MTPTHHPRADVGDWIDVVGLPGHPNRRGMVLEVLGASGHEHYRVRWDEEHESLYFPADGRVHVVHRGGGAPPPPAAP